MIKETIIIDNRTLYKTYHDKYKIKKVGTNEVYDEAIDIKQTEYELTDIEKTKEKVSEKV
jgi:hypothetical protein